MPHCRHCQQFKRQTLNKHADNGSLNRSVGVSNREIRHNTVHIRETSIQLLYLKLLSGKQMTSKKQFSFFKYSECTQWACSLIKYFIFLFFTFKLNFNSKVSLLHHTSSVKRTGECKHIGNDMIFSSHQLNTARFFNLPLAYKHDS